MRKTSIDYQAMCKGIALANGFDLSKMQEEVKKEIEHDTKKQKGDGKEKGGRSLFNVVL